MQTQKKRCFRGEKCVEYYSDNHHIIITTPDENMKGCDFMPKVNGTFICLHSCSKILSPYYNTAEFADRLCLADCFTGGNPPYGDSYIAADRNEVSRRIAAAGVLGKLFLVESNSAHNITYFLAKRAFEQLNSGNEKKKFLIVNFDQHEDYENAGNELLCSNWGANICRDLDCGCLIIGRVPKKDALLIKYNVNAKPERLSYGLDKINSVIGNYDKIYVTVDMDVLSGAERDIQRTNWQHGDIKAADLIQCLDGLPRDKIAAADITGFPPKMKKDGKPVPTVKAAVMDGYINDIISVADALCKALNHEQ